MATETARVDPGAGEQLLATKLLVPALGPEVVARPRLVERLNEATRRRVTLVAAPAGFGKTTAVAAWIAATRPPVAWLALDEGDNELGRFLAHLVGAVRARWPEVGAYAAAQLVRAPLRGPAVLGPLLNDLSAQGSPLTLVLDELRGRAVAGGARCGRLRSRPPAAQPPPGALHSRRAPPAAAAAARARPARRGHRRRPSLHARRGGALPGGGDGAEALAAGAAARCTPGPRGGSPVSSSPPSLCAAPSTATASSPASPATTGTWPTT